MNFFDLHDGLGIVSKRAAKAVAFVVLVAAMLFAPVRAWLVNQAMQREQRVVAPIAQAYVKAMNQTIANVDKPVPHK